MKKLKHLLLTVAVVAFTFTACKKEISSVEIAAVSPSVLAQIKKLGFNTSEVQKIKEGYLVEGDIVITDEQLSSLSQSHELIYGSEEHYRTASLVDNRAFSTIKVALNNTSSQHQAAFSAGLNEAIRRFNAEHLRIRFQRVSSGAHITVESTYEESNVLGSAGLPGNGAPYSQVKMNTFHYNAGTTPANINYIATIIAHEIGHCIGFRHTDYMDRSYSCGGSVYNEGSAGVGAIHIANTPSGPSAQSWMLACSDGSNRPFTNADRKALKHVY